MLAQKLIDELRDPKSNIEFDINEWGSYEGSPKHETGCGTVGCIAGTVVWLDNVSLFKRNVTKQDNNDMSTSMMTSASRLLDLKPVHANHLFLPFNWQMDLVTDDFENAHRNIWSHNYRADLDTIEKMRGWAIEITKYANIMDYIDCYAAANAVEQICINKEPYVNWQKACEDEHT